MFNQSCVHSVMGPIKVIFYFDFSHDLGIGTSSHFDFRHDPIIESNKEVIDSFLKNYTLIEK